MQETRTIMPKEPAAKGSVKRQRNHDTTKPRKRETSNGPHKNLKEKSGNNTNVSRSSPSHHHNNKNNKKFVRGPAHQKNKASSSSEPPAKRPRRHADLVEEGKRLWNELRKKTNTPEQTRQLVNELMPLITGKASELALQHDASRVVQAAIQFGTPAERKSILQELCQKQEGSSSPVFLELCKSQYGHFVVLKAIKYGHTDKDCVAAIVKALRNHMSKLCVHGIASRVVESIFQTLPSKQTAALKQELYGPHFALFAADTLREQASSIPSLSSNVAAAPDKKDQTVEYVRRLVQKGLEKQLYGYSYFQELLDEFLQVVPPSEARSLASGPASDHSIHLLSTKAGTRAVAWLIAYGTARDRKRVAKSLKGYSRSGLLHRDAYLAILRLVQLTDDTVSTHKLVFHELLAAPEVLQAEQSPLLDLALSECASKLFLWLLNDESAAASDASSSSSSSHGYKFLDPYERSVLFTNPTVLEGGEELPTSKKDPDVRRKELLQHMREPLLELCCRHTEELLRSTSGGRVCMKVYAATRSEPLVAALTDACLSSLTAPSVPNAAGEDVGAEEGNAPVPLLEDRNGHRALKALILVDAGLGKDGSGPAAQSFAVSLYNRAKSELPNGIWDVVTQSNRGAFVVGALCQVPAIHDAIVMDLTKHLEDLKRLSTPPKTGCAGATAGYAALLNVIQGVKK